MNQPRTIDYEAAEKKAYKKNLLAFSKNPFTPDSIKRMQSYAKKHFFDIEDVMKKVKEDEMFARIFVKDPFRQSVHENEAASFIRKNKTVSKFKKLPISGANALFLHDGRVITKKERDGLNLSIKSIDFYWEVKSKNGETLKFYASHKYTNEDGGSQDNQYNEQRLFLKNSRKSKMGKNVFFVAICEGNYYNKPSKKESLSKLECMLNDDTSAQNTCISLAQFDDYIEQKSKLILEETPKRRIRKIK